MTSKMEDFTIDVINAAIDDVKKEDFAEDVKTLSEYGTNVRDYYLDFLEYFADFVEDICTSAIYTVIGDDHNGFIEMVSEEYPYQDLYNLNDCVWAYFDNNLEVLEPPVYDEIEKILSRLL